jgi:polyphosphate kinase 2
MKRMKRRDYEDELRRLHGELVAMQEWVKASGAKVCVLFEGRDTAGKGGTIKAITDKVSPRVFRVVALPTPTEREKSQMYLQRYVPHLPAAGEVVIFDRSWYNRAGVERVMGFCTEEQAERFLEAVPSVEQAIVGSGVTLIKYWLEVSAPEQTRRLQSRIDDPARSGSSRRWTCCPTAAGTTTHAAATGCSPRPTRRGHRGTWCAPTTSGAAGSTSSPTS